MSPALQRDLYLETGLGPQPETDGVYEQWYIDVSGELENSMKLSIADLLEIVPKETAVM